MLSPRVFWQDSWTGRGTGMTQTLVDLGQADTPKAFWGLYEANPIMNLPLKCSLHVFRKNVKPEWEDPANIVGGHFRLSPALRGVETGQLISAAQRLWFNLLTTHVAESFSVPDAVVGCGFTNKGTRQIASLWINTTDEAIVAPLQADIQKIAGDKFSVKFVQHRAIVSESGKTEVTLCVQHRRTRSAPGRFVTVDESDDEDSNGSPRTPGSALAERRKGPQLALDSQSVGLSSTPPPEAHQRSKSDGYRKEVVPITNLINAPAPPQTVAGGAAPGGPPLPRPPGAQLLSPPLPGQGSGAFGSGQIGPHGSSGELTWGTTQDSELRSSGSGLVLPAVAPSPMKEWASGWSPSLLEAAFRAEAQARELAARKEEEERIANGGDATSPEQKEETAEGVQSQPQAPPPAPPAAVAPSPTFAGKGVQSPPHSQAELMQQQQAYHQAMIQQQMQLQAAAQHAGVMPAGHPIQVAGVMPPRPAMPPTPEYPQVQQQIPVQVMHPQQAQQQPDQRYVYNNPYAYGAMSAPPQFEVAQAPQHPAPQPPQQHHKPAPQAAAPAADAGPAKSDANAFVFKGYLFPAGLNRKERRRICFSAEFEPTNYPEAIFVGTEQADGPRDEAEEASLRKGIIPKSNNSHNRVDSEGKEKWAGAHP